MSRHKFQARLDGINKSRAVARHEHQKEPDPQRGEHVEDATLDPIFWTIRIALIGGMCIWLALDFAGASPYLPLAMAIYIGLEVARFAWQAIWGSTERRHWARQYFFWILVKRVVRAFID